MNLKKIYKTRFNDVEERKIIWKVLVTDFFQQFVKKDNIVLDVACGYGEFINQINCGKKYAIDLNPDTTKYLNKNITFYSQSSTKIKSIKNNLIDKIFVSNFFEHIKREDIVETIKEFKRTLKSGGEVLILQPNIRFCTKDYW